MLVDVVRLSAQGRRDEAHDLFDAHLPLIRYEQQPGPGFRPKVSFAAHPGPTAASATRSSWGSSPRSGTREQNLCREEVLVDGTKHALKRALDVALSGLALMVLAPVFLVLAVLVRLDSPGGAFFSQQRVGRNGEKFTMHKFRSMTTTAESDVARLAAQNEGAGVLFKMKDDPRVTRVGRVIRKYSLDELPQLWNVFVGDMSLVGPRPPLPREVAAYENHVHRRLFIKPGLTGMWQVGGRSDLDWDESVRLDLYYVENWSLTGDIIILWRTARVLLNPVGAY